MGPAPHSNAFPLKSNISIWSEGDISQHIIGFFYHNLDCTELCECYPKIIIYVLMDMDPNRIIVGRWTKLGKRELPLPSS